VVDDYLEGDVHTGVPGVEMVKQIKGVQPHTEVVVLSSHEDIGLKVEALNNGARDYILNKKGAWHRIRTIIDQRVQQPIRYFVAEYGVRVFIMVFIGWWVLLGVIAWIALRFWRNDLV
jgi:DNA-binding NarL/FixJ family response regulator